VLFPVRQFITLQTEKKKEQGRKLRIHFEQLVRGAIQTMALVTANIGIMDNDNVIIVIVKDNLAMAGESYERHNPFAESFAFEGTDEFVAFKAHYAAIDNNWRQLKNRSLKHNTNMKALHERIKGHFEKTLDSSVRDLASNEEGLGYYLPYEISEALVRDSRGEKPVYDFNVEAVNQGDLHFLRTRTLTLVKTKDTRLIGKCKRLIDETLKSQSWKQEVSGLVNSASEIGKDFDKITTELRRIESLGLMTKDPQYKFKPVKTCAICRGLFF